MPYQYLNHTAPQVDDAINSVKELQRDMPHKTSDLVNDSGFVDTDEVIGIVDARSKTGYYAVETYYDMIYLPQEKLVDGCLCYVVKEDKEYRYKEATKQWIENSLWEEI